MSFAVEPLRDHHDLEPFDCGNEKLTDWLRRSARQATRQGTRTYVLIETDVGRVAGYFALAPHLLARAEAPGRIARGAPSRIPAILLAKLALHRDHPGRGLGSALLVRAFETVVQAARTAGGKAVVVDAIDEGAARFYERHDFEPIPGNPLRLVRKLSAIARALALPWP